MLKRLTALSMGVALSLTGSAGAQDHNLPTMNAVGRFFGIGWSNGYHAGTYDGRFQAVKDRHPASMYGSNALLYPYQPGYEPQRAFTSVNQGYMQPVYSNFGDSQSFVPTQPNFSNQATPTPAPIIPPKPVEPPPVWLRPFLKDEATNGTDRATIESGKKETREEVDALEASPSDLIKPKTNQAAPPKQDKPKASDDDDLLTLTPLTPFQRYNEARRHPGSNR